MPERPYNAALKTRARELRKNATKQENRLWYEYLRDFRPRFTRQRIVGSCILDFYCGTAKLDRSFEGVCSTIANQVNALLGQPPPSADGTPFVSEGGSGEV